LQLTNQDLADLSAKTYTGKNAGKMPIEDEFGGGNLSLPLHSRVSGNDFSKSQFYRSDGRLCVSCGKPLHREQKEGSKFCSAKFVGYEPAHKCRNADSNRRNNLKRKMEKINKKGVLFDVTQHGDDIEQMKTG
jgi:hypothetical protein